MSETLKWRKLLLPYCKGKGIDIGFGGDPICEDVITFDRDISHPSYAHVGKNSRPDFIGDANNLSMFEDESFDYVYSSHCIEDFEDTKSVLVEWIRILKPYGNLCLLFPDEQRYWEVSACRNTNHKHTNMGLSFMDKILDEIPSVCYMDKQELFVRDERSNLNDGFPDYSCMLVLKKIGGFK